MQVHLGEFHRVASLAVGEHGISIWDYHDVEHFLEIIPISRHIPVVGAFGCPPEEAGFQYVEGIKLPAVTGVEVLPHNSFDDFEVRHLVVHSRQGVDLKWDLFIPRRNAC